MLRESIPGLKGGGVCEFFDENKMRRMRKCLKDRALTILDEGQLERCQWSASHSGDEVDKTG